jgi:hypothetical protein
MQHEIIQIGKRFGGFCGFFFFPLLWADMWVVNFYVVLFSSLKIKIPDMNLSRESISLRSFFFKLFVYFLNKIQKHGWMLACNIFIKKEVILEIGMLDVDSAYT